MINPEHEYDFVIYDHFGNRCVDVRMIALICHRESGRIAYFEADIPWDEENCYPMLYNWEEGNYSCDCNRSSFFAEAVDDESYETDDCNGRKFSVLIFNPKTGEILYEEEEEMVEGIKKIEIIVDNESFMVHPTINALIEGMNSELEMNVIKINEFIEEMNKLDKHLRDYYPERVAAYFVTHKKEDRSPIDLVIEILLNRKKLIVLR